MPALARRRGNDPHRKTWHVYYGDVHIGTISERAGVPHDVDQSQPSAPRLTIRNGVINGIGPPKSIGGSISVNACRRGDATMFAKVSTISVGVFFLGFSSTNAWSETTSHTDGASQTIPSPALTESAGSLLMASELQTQP
jgi:hypothetical protein